MLYDAINNVLIVVAFLMAMTVGLTVICRDYRHFNGLKRRDDANIYQALFDRFYFIIVTVSTMGYGDISPATNRAKAAVIVIVLFVVVTLLNTFAEVISGYDKHIKNMLVDLVQTSSKQLTIRHGRSP
jgi:hypothetical protein